MSQSKHESGIATIWVPEGEVSSCTDCRSEFSLFKRKVKHDHL